MFTLKAASTTENGPQASGDEETVAQVRQRDRLRATGLASVRTAGILIPLVCLWIVLSILSPVFASEENIRNILLQSSVIGVLAFGSTVVLIAGEIDLTIGSLEGLTAVVAGVVVINLGAPWWLGMAAAVGSGAVVGLVNGLIIVMAGVPSFITTLAMLNVALGLSQRLSNGQTLAGFPNAYQVIGQHKFVLGLGLPVLVMLVVLIVIWFMLRRTRLGLNIYAVGDNPRAARLAGVRPKRVKIIAFVISGACAGIAGILVSSQLDAASSGFGANDLLNAIAAVVIGGTALTGGSGSVIGSFLGVLVIATIQNGLVLLNVSPLLTPVFVGGVILGAAALHRVTRGRVED